MGRRTSLAPRHYKQRRTIVPVSCSGRRRRRSSYRYRQRVPIMRSAAVSSFLCLANSCLLPTLLPERSAIHDFLPPARPFTILAVVYTRPSVRCKQHETSVMAAQWYLRNLRKLPLCGCGRLGRWRMPQRRRSQPGGGKGKREILIPKSETSTKRGNEANPKPDGRFVLSAWDFEFVSCFGIPVSCFLPRRGLV